MNIKDFAHYYIGQRCLNTWFSEEHPNYNPGWVLTGFDRDAHRPFKLETEEDFTWTDSIKPVLRRLEDMTEEDKARVGFSAMIKDEIMWTPEKVHYLLKQGFDLFNLIDQNLAEDIKNIQPPQM